MLLRHSIQHCLIQFQSLKLEPNSFYFISRTGEIQGPFLTAYEAETQTIPNLKHEGMRSFVYLNKALCFIFGTLLTLVRDSAIQKAETLARTCERCKAIDDYYDLSSVMHFALLFLSGYALAVHKGSFSAILCAAFIGYLWVQSDHRPTLDGRHFALKIPSSLADFACERCVRFDTLWDDKARGVLGGKFFDPRFLFKIGYLADEDEDTSDDEGEASTKSVQDCDDNDEKATSDVEATDAAAEDEEQEAKAWGLE